MTKNLIGEERIYLAYTSTLSSIIEQDMNTNRAGISCRAGAEAIEGCYVLACSPISL